MRIQFSLNRTVLLLLLCQLQFRCNKTSIEAVWQFEHVAHSEKMVADFNTILYKIPDRTKIYMRESGIIQPNDSLSVFFDSTLSIRFYQTREILPMLIKRFAMGSIGCNNKFKIRYLSGGGKIFFKEIHFSRLPCSSFNQNFLFMYREYLFSTNRYRTAGDTLVLGNLFSNDLVFIKRRTTSL